MKKNNRVINPNGRFLQSLYLEDHLACVEFMPYTLQIKYII